MPVIRCSEGNKPGFKWGSRGKCYTYAFSDKVGKREAQVKAAKQGQAAHAAGYRGRG